MRIKDILLRRTDDPDSPLRSRHRRRSPGTIQGPCRTSLTVCLEALLSAEERTLDPKPKKMASATKLTKTVADHSLVARRTLEARRRVSIRALRALARNIRGAHGGQKESVCWGGRLEFDQSSQWTTLARAPAACQNVKPSIWQLHFLSQRKLAFPRTSYCFSQRSDTRHSIQYDIYQFLFIGFMTH